MATGKLNSNKNDYVTIENLTETPLKDNVSFNLLLFYNLEVNGIIFSGLKTYLLVSLIKYDRKSRSNTPNTFTQHQFLLLMVTNLETFYYRNQIHFKKYQTQSF